MTPMTNDPQLSMNLTLLFDGTWNDPQDRTNVFRL